VALGRRRHRKESSVSFTNAVCVLHLTAIVERERLFINVPKQEDSDHSRTQFD